MLVSPTKIIYMYEKHIFFAEYAQLIIWHLFTHPDLPVQDISGDVDSSHGLATKHKLGSGLEVPGVKAQRTFTLSFLRISCTDVKKTLRQGALYRTDTYHKTLILPLFNVTQGGRVRTR